MPMNVGFGKRACSCLVLASVVLVSGCAFPIFQSDRDSRRFTYNPARVREQQAREAARDPSEQGARAADRDGRAPQAQRRQGSVMTPLLADPPDPRDGMLPSDPSDCYAQLRQRRIPFEVVDDDEAGGVRMPIRLHGPIDGVTFAPADKDQTHATLDCRLALALQRWTVDLRAAGVVRVEHYSMYRPGARVGGGRRVSGHAHGLAMDAARFTLFDGTLLEVLTDWEGRERGGSPCPMRPDESFGSRLLRSVACNAVSEQLFQVVITPHHDKAHANHVHVEVKPEVSWTYVR